MEYKFLCPICRGHIQVDEDQSGHRAACPHCAKTIIIPEPLRLPFLNAVNNPLCKLVKLGFDGKINAAKARVEFKEMVEKIPTNQPLNPAERSFLNDLLLDSDRMELVFNFNIELLSSLRKWYQGSASAALEAAPAQELFRLEIQKECRDWLDRWIKAGGKIFEKSRMIALKADPIWLEISDFDYPFPPFSIGSGMWVRDILRPEAIALGLLNKKGEIPQVEKYENVSLLSIQDIRISDYLATRDEDEIEEE